MTLITDSKPILRSTTSAKHGPVSRTQILLTLRVFAEDPGLADLVDLNATERQWHQAVVTPQLQVWVIAWPPGSSTGWHDHGGAEGAFRVVRGSLFEHVWTDKERTRKLSGGDLRVFSGNHVHNVRNESAEPALSVHAYSPSLDAMTRYEIVEDQLRVVAVDEGAEW